MSFYLNQCANFCTCSLNVSRTMSLSLYRLVSCLFSFISNSWWFLLLFLTDEIYVCLKLTTELLMLLPGVSLSSINCRLRSLRQSVERSLSALDSSQAMHIHSETVEHLQLQPNSRLNVPPHVMSATIFRPSSVFSPDLYVIAGSIFDDNWMEANDMGKGNYQHMWIAIMRWLNKTTAKCMNNGH